MGLTFTLQPEHATPVETSNIPLRAITMDLSSEKCQWMRKRYISHYDLPSSLTGTEYPCDQKDLDNYQNLTRKNHAASVSREKATDDLVKHNDSGRENEAVLAAEKRIQAACNKKDEPWLPDLIIKMFADLDLVFFGGYLLGNVEIKWVNDRKVEDHVGEDHPQPGYTEWFSEHHERPGQAKIRLNATRILMIDHGDYDG